jgi:hypothetical protein
MGQHNERVRTQLSKPHNVGMASPGFPNACAAARMAIDLKAKGLV